MTIPWAHLTITYPRERSVIEAHALHCRHAALGHRTEPAESIASLHARLTTMATFQADLTHHLSGTRPVITGHLGRCLTETSGQCTPGEGLPAPTSHQGPSAVRDRAIDAVITALGGDETRTGHTGDLGPFATYRALASAAADAIGAHFALTTHSSETTVH